MRQFTDEKFSNLVTILSTFKWNILLKGHWSVFFGSQFKLLFTYRLQNANAKFHNVVYRHYSCDVEKVSTVVW